MPWTVAHQVPLSIGLSRQEYLSGLPFPSPGDLPNPRRERGSPAVQADSLPTELPGKPSLIQPENHPNPAAHKNFHISSYCFLERVLHPQGQHSQSLSWTPPTSQTDCLDWGQITRDLLPIWAKLFHQLQMLITYPRAVPLHQADLDTRLVPLPTSQMYLQRL